MLIVENLNGSIIIECEKCKSRNTELLKWMPYEKEMYKKKSVDLKSEFWQLKSYKKTYNYQCLDCGYENNENGNIKFFI